MKIDTKHHTTNQFPNKTCQIEQVPKQIQMHLHGFLPASQMGLLAPGVVVFGCCAAHCFVAPRPGSDLSGIMAWVVSGRPYLNREDPTHAPLGPQQ